MNKEIAHTNGIGKTSIQLPAGSLFRDLHAETGSGDGLEWLLLFENDPCTILPRTRLLYAKVIILTSDGRKNAENGQAKILSFCNFRKFDTAELCKALAYAMSLWDSEH